MAAAHTEGMGGATSSQLLGFPPDARVLIVNCDDLGMHESVNVAVIDAIEEGIASSCSLMVPCPGASQALRMLRARPGIPFGIHLTLVRDADHVRWGPLSARGTVASLLDERGELFTAGRREELLARARPEEVEREFRAQIEAVADAGLTPTHLDWHCLADGGHEDVFEVTVALAGEYGLAVRVWLDGGRRTARGRGLPVTDHDFLDSFALDTDGKAARYAELLRALPPGLSEWAVHPGLDDARSRAAEPGGGWRVRHGDHAFLTSARARELLAEEGIVVIDYRPLQRIWSGGRAT
ncbi:hypothetical protein GCM10009574_065780 [Streptomyces asiaticus]|uniref:ChbG/HpnK family deacetylase n=2 Tax=Streptomyces TaxID=1883 RepID=A0ABN1S385_9ACTN